MIDRKILSVTVVLALASATAGPAAAQFGGLGAIGKMGGLGGMIPGGRTSGAASVDPNAFLAETIETTKFMMIAAAVLAQAADTDKGRDSLRAEIAAIQNISDIGELNARKEAFATNIEAASLNYADADKAQQRYNSATKDQQKLLMTAAYNFSLGMARNVQLSAQAPQLLSSIKANPMLLSKVGSMTAAAGLIGQQAKAAYSMGQSLRTLMSHGGVEVPSDSHAAKPQTVEIL